MDINLIGNKIKFVRSVESDIDKIIEFEKSNSLYVNHYSKEKHIELLSDNDCIHLTIRKVDSNKLVGHMILFGGKSKNLVLEFRRLAIDEKGFGYGREAVKLLKKLCFEELNFHRLWLDVYDDNSKAIYVYESEGFILEGTLRDNYKIEGGYRSQKIYSILEDEYNEINF